MWSLERIQSGKFNKENALFLEDLKETNVNEHIIPIDVALNDYDKVKVNSNVDSVIIAKAVLATGCTAIVLAKRAIEQYNPKELIIATAFHSKEGVAELKEVFPQAKLILLGKPDILEKSNGFLMPGVGNLDERIREVA